MERMIGKDFVEDWKALEVNALLYN